jgi:hypothetical protein
MRRALAQSLNHLAIFLFLVDVTELIMNGSLSSREATTRPLKSPGDHLESKHNQADNEEHDAMNESKESFGLFRLNLDDCASCVRNFEETTETFNTDIIAIHGLGGTAFKTWTHSNGKNWLRDFVPSEFPGARVYTFGYDSGFAFSRGTGTVNDFARSFLEAVKLERSRPDQVSFQLVPTNSYETDKIICSIVVLSSSYVTVWVA